MGYTVTITDTADGSASTAHYPYDWDEGQLYWWTDGNYGCDCNRHLSFLRGLGKNPDLDDVTCYYGPTGLYAGCKVDRATRFRVDSIVPDGSTDVAYTELGLGVDGDEGGDG